MYANSIIAETDFNNNKKITFIIYTVKKVHEFI